MIDQKNIPASEMTEAELDAALKAVKLERERIALEKDRLNQAEKERALCTISTALSTFNRFLLEFKDYILSIPDEVQSIVPNLTPDQYEALKESVDIQIRRLHDKTIALTITDTRSEAEASTDVSRERKRAANRSKGIK